MKYRKPRSFAEGGSVETDPVDEQDYLENQAYWDEVFRERLSRPADLMRGGTAEAFAEPNAPLTLSADLPTSVSRPQYASSQDILPPSSTGFAQQGGGPEALSRPPSRGPLDLFKLTLGYDTAPARILNSGGDIPGISPFFRETVRPAAGNLAVAALNSNPITPFLADKLGVNLTNPARSLGEALIPVTANDFVVEASPIGILGDISRIPAVKRTGAKFFAGLPGGDDTADLLAESVRRLRAGETTADLAKAARPIAPGPNVDDTINTIRSGVTHPEAEALGMSPSQPLQPGRTARARAVSRAAERERAGMVPPASSPIPPGGEPAFFPPDPGQRRVAPNRGPSMGGIPPREPPPSGLFDQRASHYGGGQPPPSDQPNLPFGSDLPPRDGAPPLTLEGQRPDVPRANLADHVYTWFQNSILSAAPSANALGNAAFTLTRPIERGLAAAIDIPLRRIQGRETARYFEEVPADVIGMIEGLPKGTRSALQVLKTGKSANSAKYDSVRAFEKGITGRAVRAPTIVLEATDALNFEIAYNGEEAALIVRQARSEGRKGQALIERIAELKRLPTPKIIEDATAAAEYRLFRDDPGRIGKALLNVQREVPGVRYVLPFVRTPANLLGAGLERSPLGLANPSLWRNLKSGSPEAADQLARITFGSTIGGGMAALIADGTIDITGGLPRNPAERDRFYREGKQPYALRIGDKWVQYQRLEPFNQPLAQLAAVVEAVRNKDDKSAKDRAFQFAETVGNNFTSQTYLSGISNLMDVFTNPKAYGERFAGRLLGGFVPLSSVTRDVAQASDPIVRDPQGVGEQVMTGIPGLSDNVSARLTAFGQPAQRGGSPFSPINITNASQSDVDAALEELSTEVGFVGNTINNLPLNREQQSLYQQGAGQHTYNLLNMAVSDPRWDSLEEREKVAALTKIVTASRDLVRTPVSDALDLVTSAEEFTSLSREQQEGLLKSKEFNLLISQILQRAMPQAGDDK